MAENSFRFGKDQIERAKREKKALFGCEHRGLKYILKQSKPMDEEFSMLLFCFVTHIQSGKTPKAAFKEVFGATP